ALRWQDVNERVRAWMPIAVERVNWFSTYRVHHRVAEHFRRGRAFLLGDAAHIHSPVGAQGMNTGIGDAVNLAWKLAAVLRGEASEAILDSFENERIGFARRLVATTDRGFTAVTSTQAGQTFVRLHLVPWLVRPAFAAPALRRLMFRTISQIAVHYRGSALSSGRAGRIAGGDRLPWVGDNFIPLNRLAWQAHVYGAATAPVQAACADLRIPLLEFPWRPQASAAGLARDAVYLVRPDGYVGLAQQRGDAAALAQYWNSRLLATQGGDGVGAHGPAGRD
ncbi:MAG: FAD-dependent monooxygenase, partial [Terriglobales bacterium]